MKKFPILLAVCLFISVNLTGQHTPSRPDAIKKPAFNLQNDKSHRSLIPDSMQVGPDYHRKSNRNLPAFKSNAVYKQKMDSLLTRRYNPDTAGLRTLNQGWFAYDKEGRLILDIVYTCNTQDGEYAWFKDTASFYSDNKLSFEASYSRILESEPWLLENKFEKYYDANGNDTMTVIDERDWETDEWYKSKEIKSFDSDNLMTGSISYVLDPAIGEWITTGKYELSYDSDGNLLTECSFVWSVETGEWIKGVKSEHSYDSDGNLLTESSFDWSAETGEWIHSGESEYTYDAHGHVTSNVFYYFYDGTWYGSWRQENAYDNNGNLTLEMYFDWNLETGQWQPYIKVTWAFNSRNQETEYSYSFWNGEKNQLEPSERQTKAYDTNGYLAESMTYGWNSESNQWIPEGKNAFSNDSNGKDTLAVRSVYNAETGIWNVASITAMDFDDNGNLAHSLDEYAKGPTGEWMSKFEVDYTYNYSYKDDEAVTPYGWYGEEPVNLLLSSAGRLWTASSGVWIDYMITDYWYSEFGSNSSSPEEPSSPVRVYPNPVNDMVFIDADPTGDPMQFEMVDLSGKKVISKTLDGLRYQVSVNELPAGLYLYRITRNGKTSFGKIVKK